MSVQKNQFYLMGRKLLGIHSQQVWWFFHPHFFYKQRLHRTQRAHLLPGPNTLNSERECAVDLVRVINLVVLSHFQLIVLIANSIFIGTNFRGWKNFSTVESQRRVDFQHICGVKRLEKAFINALCAQRTAICSMSDTATNSHWKSNSKSVTISASLSLTSVSFVRNNWSLPILYSCFREQFHQV